MKNGDYFKGIFSRGSDNPNYKKIREITFPKWEFNFGFYDDYWYQLVNGTLDCFIYKPTTGEEITYQIFEDWILEKAPENTQYEVY